MTRTFIRKKEDFVCAKCGEQAKGNGYTNHCPNCLWSKHVDVNPGDRASECCGMMRPNLHEVKGDKYTIKHTCVKCGHQKENKRIKDDKIEKVIGRSR